MADVSRQLGARPIDHGRPLKLRSRKGGDPAEWPKDLRVRQWPAPQEVAAL